MLHKYANFHASTIQFSAKKFKSTFLRILIIHYHLDRTHLNFSNPPFSSLWSIFRYYPLTPESIVKLQHMFFMAQQIKIKIYFRFYFRCGFQLTHSASSFRLLTPSYPKRNGWKEKSDEVKIIKTFSFTTTQNFSSPRRLCSMHKRQPWRFLHTTYISSSCECCGLLGIFIARV